MKYITEVEINNLTHETLNYIKRVFITKNSKYRNTAEIVEKVFSKKNVNEEWLYNNIGCSYIEPIYHEVHREGGSFFTLIFHFKSDYFPVELFNEAIKKVKKISKPTLLKSIIFIGRSWEENYLPDYPMFNFLIDSDKTFWVRKHSIEYLANEMKLDTIKVKVDDADKIYWKMGEPHDEDRILLDDFLVWSQETDLANYIKKRSQF